VAKEWERNDVGSVTSGSGTRANRMMSTDSSTTQPRRYRQSDDTDTDVGNGSAAVPVNDNGSRSGNNNGNECEASR